MSSQLKVLVFTHIPSPYQVELFNRLAEQGNLDLSVAYLRALSGTSRRWQTPDLKHSHLFLSEDSEADALAETLTDKADLVVFNYYQHLGLQKLIQHRNDRQQPWCFWGERPGYRQMGYLGRYYRRWKLTILHQSKAPIWGIGQWAVDEYQREFGSDRHYMNLPYFSDLDRFNLAREIPATQGDRHFLFSGSLIPRKGVDLLAIAFSRLVQEFPNVRLSLVGEGELRPHLEQRLRRYGDLVQFLGFQPWDALPQIYQTADILCVPSRYDGWAMVVPEGLAMGLPVISTHRTGAALELIQNNENGWLIPAENAEAIYQAMKQAVLLSPTELSTRSQTARKTATQHSLAQGCDRFFQTVQETVQSFHDLAQMPRVL